MRVNKQFILIQNDRRASVSNMINEALNWKHSSEKISYSRAHSGKYKKNILVFLRGQIFGRVVDQLPKSINWSTSSAFRNHEFTQAKRRQTRKH